MNNHCGLKDSFVACMSQYFDIKKMYEMSQDKHISIKVSYYEYRETCPKEFNVSFGYPCIDTCSKRLT